MASRLTVCIDLASIIVHNTCVYFVHKTLRTLFVSVLLKQPFIHKHRMTCGNSSFCVRRGFRFISAVTQLIEIGTPISAILRPNVAFKMLSFNRMV